MVIDRNHENHALLDSLPVSQWKGGKVHFTSDSIIHLMRGQIYNIEDKKVFTFGGAASVDRQHRVKDISWWERELPSVDECEDVQNKHVGKAKDNNRGDIWTCYSLYNGYVCVAGYFYEDTE